jgi:ElaB/YqjD/DUF883 family membrane-anchored ribosome-binding protein
MNTEALNSSWNDLRNDLQAVARDAEALLKATADVGGERIDEIRSRTQETLRRAYDHLSERNQQVHHLARGTGEYIREHSWSAVAVAAGVGLLIGAALVRSGRRSTTLSD